jgi:chromate transport protein ChrA
MLLYILGTRVTGRWRPALVLVPTVALPAVYAAAGWPMYVALYSHVPKSVQWLAGLLTLALCAAIVVVATAAAERWRAAEHREPSRSQSPIPMEDVDAARTARSPLGAVHG